MDCEAVQIIYKVHNDLQRLFEARGLEPLLEALLEPTADEDDGVIGLPLQHGLDARQVRW